MYYRERETRYHPESSENVHWIEPQGFLEDHPAVGEVGQILHGGEFASTSKEILPRIDEESSQFEPEQIISQLVKSGMVLHQHCVVDGRYSKLKDYRPVKLLATSQQFRQQTLQCQH